MWYIAGSIALAIFLTCTFFVTIYGLAYFGIMKFMDLIAKIRKKYWKLKQQKREYNED